MGYPNNTHIKAFVKGQVIDDIAQDANGFITLHFISGESLRLYSRVKRQPVAELETIATPYKSDGVVKQSTECVLANDKAEPCGGRAQPVGDPSEKGRR